MSGHLFPLLIVLQSLLMAGPVEPVKLLLAPLFFLIAEDLLPTSSALTNEELPVSHNAANLASVLEGVLE